MDVSTATALESSTRRRWQMVNAQLAARGIRDARVIHAFLAVPREAFVDQENEALAYADHPLPIGEGQTISQPYIVALMAESLDIGPGDRVLEVGTGSGYGAAILGELARDVRTIERLPSLAERARRRLTALGYAHVHVHVGDGATGYAPGAPYDAIAVTAGAPAIPEALLQQLAIGGRLVLPVGPMHMQRLVRLRRLGDHSFHEDDLGPVAFVPLIGAGAYAEGAVAAHDDAA
jgi:protein-L-isoaspartate(D-aspartate) O-methyltransferase